MQSVSETIALSSGRELEYAVYGADSGPSLLFCHGVPGSCVLARLFEETATEAGVRVIAPSRPGYGRSDHTPLSFASWADACAQLLDALGVERTAVCGFSGGGPFALAVAGHLPERVECVDLVGPVVPESVTEPFATLSQAGQLLGRVLRAIDWVGRVRGPAVVVSQLTDESVSSETASVVAADVHHAVDRQTAGIVAESRLFASDWYLPVVPVSVPIGLYHGRADTNVRFGPVENALGADCDAVVRPATDHLGTLLAVRERIVSGARS